MGTASLVVTSGKGGVGKSVVAANLAVALGRAGHRVLLVDGDMGLGNVATLLGLAPVQCLESVLAGDCPAAAALVAGPEGVSVLCAESDGNTAWAPGAVPAAAAASLQELEQQFDILVVDTGAGVEPRVVDLVGAATLALVVVTPEPTAVADAYAALKLVLHRPAAPACGLVVNMADTATEAAQLHERFAELVRRFLGAEIDNWGYIPLDRGVREAVKHQIPFVLTTPPTQAAAAVAQVAGAVLPQLAPEAARGKGFFASVLRRTPDAGRR